MTTNHTDPNHTAPDPTAPVHTMEQGSNSNAMSAPISAAPALISQPDVDLRTINEPGKICNNCSQKGWYTSCDLQYRAPFPDGFANPCSNCRWFGGANGKCFKGPSLNDALYSSAVSQHPQPDGRLKMPKAKLELDPINVVHPDWKGVQSPLGEVDLPSNLKGDHIAQKLQLRQKKAPVSRRNYAPLHGSRSQPTTTVTHNYFWSGYAPALPGQNQPFPPSPGLSPSMASPLPGYPMPQPHVFGQPMALPGVPPQWNPAAASPGPMARPSGLPMRPPTSATSPGLSPSMASPLPGYPRPPPHVSGQPMGPPGMPPRNPATASPGPMAPPPGLPTRPSVPPTPPVHTMPLKSGSMPPVEHRTTRSLPPARKDNKRGFEELEETVPYAVDGEALQFKGAAKRRRVFEDQKEKVDDPDDEDD